MRMKTKWLRCLLVGIAGIAVLAVGGPFIYINFLQGDAPSRLTTGSRDGVAAPTSTVPASGIAEGIDGTWTVTAGSQVGYRVKENLFGQQAEAVGRTNQVAGQLSIDGATVRSATFEVDLASIRSDKSRRDGQFKGRIMSTAQYPTASFTLTEPIVFRSVPSAGTEMTATAIGNLTMRGITKPVTFQLTARRNGPLIEASGAIPITFADWNIPDPSVGPIKTEKNGLIEFLLVFDHA
jgi:polyisoprenoid-binding protein YceI